jgi:hypothetical protein
MEMATPEGPPRSWMLVIEDPFLFEIEDERRLVVLEVAVTV